MKLLISLLLLALFTGCTTYVKVPQKLPRFELPEENVTIPTFKTGKTVILGRTQKFCVDPYMMQGHVYIIVPSTIEESVHENLIVTDKRDHKRFYKNRRKFITVAKQQDIVAEENNKKVP